MNEALTQALGAVFCRPEVPLIIAATAAYGVFMGAVPGLTATMAVALLVPVTFFLDPIPALAAVVTLEACAIFAGDIPNTLLRIPGTPSSAAYADDAYALTRAGQSQLALGTCLTFSVAGGLFGTFVLMLFAPQLAWIAKEFSSAEYFWLYLLGLSCAVVVSRGSTLQAATALVIGLLLSTVGFSHSHTVARFTFGQPQLYQGINFIPAMIGLFGISEILRNLLAIDEKATPTVAADAPRRAPGGGLLRRLFIAPFASLFGPALPLLWRRKWHALRSASIGSAVGILPGAGADIGAWVSLAASKRTSKTPEQYGKGSLEGVADATAANNSALAGAWVPALVFGIPGDSITAIVIGVLLMKDITPGPEIFEKQGHLVYSIYLMFLLANLALIPVGVLAIKAGGYVVRVPRRVLLPVILLFCVIGAYAINANAFDVGVMLAMGILGFALERRRIPLGPVVLGIILGGPLEERFLQTLSKYGGSPGAFFGFIPEGDFRLVSLLLGILCLGIWLVPAVASSRRGRARPIDDEKG
ncbi:MAG: tripartite tricarboxylate transporter permease [Planctomycetota bacterium]|jgi:TctA family transporter